MKDLKLRCGLGLTHNRLLRGSKASFLRAFLPVQAEEQIHAEAFEISSPTTCIPQDYQGHPLGCRDLPSEIEKQSTQMNLSKPNLSKLAQGILIFLFISVINVLMVIKFPMREIITYVHLPPTLHLLEGGGGGGPGRRRRLYTG